MYVNEGHDCGSLCQIQKISVCFAEQLISLKHVHVRSNSRNIELSKVSIRGSQYSRHSVISSQQNSCNQLTICYTSSCYQLVI